MSRVPVRIVTDSAAAPAGWVVLRPAACPCCVGRVQIQVELARLIRQRRPSGVQIELADAGHLAAVRRVLGEGPLSQYLEL